MDSTTGREARFILSGPQILVEFGPQKRPAEPDAAFSGKKAEKRARHDFPYAMPEGVWVSVRDLTKASELNGSVGKVLSWDPDKSRYEVELHGESKSLRPINLTQKCQVVVTGIEKRPELNGQRAHILQFDISIRRYKVCVQLSKNEAQQELLIQPANIVLKEGTHVTITGLTNNQELNGEMARVTSYDESNKKYIVETRSGKTLKLRSDNVIC